MTRQEFLSRVAARSGGLADPAELTRAVLEVLGERLSRLEAHALADGLPRELGVALRDRAHGQDFSLEGFLARLVERTGAREGIAKEQAEIVCETIAEAVGADAVSRLRRELPQDLAELFTLREVDEPPVHPHPNRRTLAEGRPGSERPLYAASADRAQSQSVVRSDNPHADTKLSSTHGLTQEQDEETLATGRPGSSRPLSDAEPGVRE